MRTKTDPEYERIGDEVSVARRLYKEYKFYECIEHIRELRIQEGSPHYRRALQIVIEAQAKLRYISLLDSGEAECLILVPEASKILYLKGTRKTEDTVSKEDEDKSIDDCLSELNEIIGKQLN